MIEMKVRLKFLALAPFILMLSCSGSGSGEARSTDTDSSDASSTPADASDTAFGDSSSSDTASSDSSPRDASSDTSASNGGNGGSSDSTAGAELPFTGTLTLDHDGWIDIIEDYFGIVQVALPSGRVRRFLEGHDGSRHPHDGSTVFLQACGASASRVALADERGANIRLLTPCSSELANPRATSFAKPVVSPDGTRVAVEASYFGAFLNPDEAGLRLYDVIVFDMQGNELGRSGGWAPAWTPDGRLVLGRSDGVYLADGDLAESAVRIDDGQLTGPVFDPKVHPDGTSVIFEYNQRIWQINLDGSGLEEVAFGPAKLSSPVFSPDGTAIAFLASENEIGALIYFKDLASDLYYPLDIRAQLPSNSSDGIPGGPLTWTP